LSNINHDEYIKKIFRSEINKNKIYDIQNELVDFQLDTYEYFSKKAIYFDQLKTNITKDEYFVFTRFLTFFDKPFKLVECDKNVGTAIDKPFKLVECDKNVGTAIISHQLYKELCLKNLDTPDFEQISYDPLEEIKLKIKNNLDDLFQNDDISLKLLDFLSLENSKLGNYRVLMKIHKNKFSTRPIINCRSHPTENLSWLVDTLLKPLIVLTESYIQDSQNLLQKTKDRIFEPNCEIYSCDFEGLYSNIDLENALNVIYDFMKDKINSIHLNYKAFYVFLKLIFENNYFIYDKKFYRQLKGIAMGTKAGPSIANIYLYILEKSFLYIHKPLYYSRFIDDIFIIVLNGFDISLLPTFFHNLKLNISEKNTEPVVFLDLNIKLNKQTKKLNFTVYKKPTGTFQQLLCSSNHQKKIIKHNPFGSYLRIRRICTYSHDYIHLARVLTYQLMTRGYEFKFLVKVSHTVLNLNRDKLIEYKPKKRIDFSNCILLRMNFDLNYVQIQNDIKKIFKNCFREHPILKSFKLKILNKTQTNFGCLTINNIKPELLLINKFQTKKCNIYNCLICPNLATDHFIKLNNFYLPLDLKVNCNTTHVVYAINCKLCKDVFYIGETERKVSARFKEHLRDIKNFIPYIKYNPVVAYHFNLKGHRVKRDIKFHIIQDNLKILKSRLDFENNVIQLLLKLNFKILNDPEKIRNRYNFGNKI